MKDFQIEQQSLNIVLVSYLVFISFSLFWDNSLVTGFGTMWALALFKLNSLGVNLPINQSFAFKTQYDLCNLYSDMFA